jgi:hypothetical protein
LPDAACYEKKAWAAEPQQPSLLHKRSCVSLRNLRRSASLLQQDDGLPRIHDPSDRFCRATPTSFVTHTITSQPESCQARNATPTNARMTLCASTMSCACGPWPCGVSGTDVGVNGANASCISRARATRDPNRVVIRARSQCLLLPICSRATTKNQHCSVNPTLLHRVAY